MDEKTVGKRLVFSLVGLMIVSIVFGLLRGQVVAEPILNAYVEITKWFIVAFIGGQTLTDVFGKGGKA